MSTDSETYPELSLVGWYTFGDEPLPWHATIQIQLKKKFECDSALFMLYHHNQLSGSSGGKLPYTIYESFSSQESEGMEVDAPYQSGAMKFRPITFSSLETFPDEAIALADVVQLATNANAIQQPSLPGSKDQSKGKGKAIDRHHGNNGEQLNYLSAEDEDRELCEILGKAFLICTSYSIFNHQSQCDQHAKVSTPSHNRLSTIPKLIVPERYISSYCNGCCSGPQNSSFNICPCGSSEPSVAFRRCGYIK
jgi:hypothetical protein